jgi:hypothetical protein
MIRPVEHWNHAGIPRSPDPRLGGDWSDLYPAIARAAAKLRARSFTIDGEAAVCGPDGIAVFDALHRRGTVRSQGADEERGTPVAVMWRGCRSSWGSGLGALLAHAVAGGCMKSVGRRIAWPSAAF